MRPRAHLQVTRKSPNKKITALRDVKPSKRERKGRKIQEKPSTQT